MDRTIVKNRWPNWAAIAFSASRASDVSAAADAVKTTFPLDRTVLTSSKPCCSKHRLSSAIFTFIGLTPRRKATYRGIGYFIVDEFRRDDPTHPACLASPN